MPAVDCMAAKDRASKGAKDVDPLNVALPLANDIEMGQFINFLMTRTVLPERHASNK